MKIDKFVRCITVLVIVGKKKDDLLAALKYFLHPDQISDWIEHFQID